MRQSRSDFLCCSAIEAGVNVLAMDIGLGGFSVASINSTKSFLVMIPTGRCDSSTTQRCLFYVDLIATMHTTEQRLTSYPSCGIFDMLGASSES